MEECRKQFYEKVNDLNIYKLKKDEMASVIRKNFYVPDSKIYMGDSAEFRRIVTHCTKPEILERLKVPIPYLTSFYNFRNEKTQIAKKDLINFFTKNDFLLDSGAFTFMNKGSITDEQLEVYVENYIKFINNNNIDRYFEMDIDVLIGLDRVEEIRKKLIEETGKKPIPVWHKSRGDDKYLEICEQYDFIAIGGIANNKNAEKDGWTVSRLSKEMLMELFFYCELAHKNNCIVHGLGFTNCFYLNEDILPFDTCDSTSWTMGAIRGTETYFKDNQMMRKYVPVEVFDRKDCVDNTFIGWTDFILNHEYRHEFNEKESF